MLKPQEKNFTGYNYHKKETDLGTLWESFKQHMKQSQEHSDRLQQMPGHCSVSTAWQDREILKEEIKNNTI